jgi:SNF2 family DNA or RNA helicase
MTAETQRPPAREASVEFDGDAVVIRGPSLISDRQARLYFGSLLGGQELTDGWRCPRRSRALAEFALQINSYLVKRGYQLQRGAGVEESIRRDEERRRSFDRTREAARDLRAGISKLGASTIERELRAAGWNFGQRSLRPHQIDGVIHGLTVGNPGNFSVPGSGKTATALALATIHKRSGTIDTVLVVGPLSSFRPWESETMAAAPGLRPSRVRGDAVTRRNRYREVGPGDLIIISFATAVTDQQQLIALCDRLNVMLVVDESHRVKRFRGGTWAPALMEIAKHARVRVVLTGTPMPQSGRDLYSQLNILWPGRELTGPRDPFAVDVRDRFDHILERVLPFVFRTPKEALGLRPPIIMRHPVELSAEEAEIYRLVAANLRRRAQAVGPSERSRLEALRRGRPIRLLQAATNPELLRRVDPALPVPRISGTPTLLSRLDLYDPELRPPAKIMRAIELLGAVTDDSQRRKSVVWSSFISNLDRFASIARERLKVPVFQIDGRVPTGDDVRDDGRLPLQEVSETRENTIASFLACDGSALLVANPASCSESISLHTSCHVAIYLDRTYDCAQWLQSIDRIHRLGLSQDIEVEIHILQSTLGVPRMTSLSDSCGGGMPGR